MTTNQKDSNTKKVSLFLLAKTLSHLKNFALGFAARIYQGF